RTRTWTPPSSVRSTQRTCRPTSRSCRKGRYRRNYTKKQSTASPLRVRRRSRAGGNHRCNSIEAAESTTLNQLCTAPTCAWRSVKNIDPIERGIRNGKPVSPGSDAAVTRHRLLDDIVGASETGTKQGLEI